MPAEQEEILAWEASDGYVIRFRHWAPETPAKGHIVALHGIQSHSGWYRWSSGMLAKSGYAVHFMDRRGSGLNWRSRGDAPSWRRLAADVVEYVHELKAGVGEPVFLMAGSWGAKVAAAAALRCEDDLAGLVLWCPGFYPKLGPKRGQRLRILLARAFRPAKRFPIPLSDPALFTSDPKRQVFIAADPLTIHEATARLLVESVRLDGYIRRFGSKLRLPVLLLLADRDRIIDNSRTRAFLFRWCSQDRFIIEYPRTEHTLEFEPRPERFVDDLRAWLDQHNGLASSA